MIKNLRINNFQTIKNLNIDFDNNLSIFTGQTGSGKSSIIKALKYLLGQRINYQEFDSNQKTIIEASFKVNAKAKRYLKEIDIELDKDFITIKKIINQNSSISKINNINVNLKDVQILSEYLLEFHEQNYIYLFFEKNKDVQIIDKFLSKDDQIILENYLNKYKELKDLKYQKNKFNVNHKISKEEFDLLNNFIKEFESADINLEKEENYKKKEKEIKSTQNKIKLYKKTKNILSLEFYENLKELEKNFKQILNSDKHTNFYYEIMDLEDQINDKISQIDQIDHEQINKYLFVISDLKRKHGVFNTQDLIQKINSYKEKVKFYKSYDKKTQEIETKIIKTKTELEKINNDLRKARFKAFDSFKDKIIKELKDLDFNFIEFKLKSSPKKEFSRSGKDDYDFLISFNKGKEPTKISKSASGGELARFILAYKICLLEHEDRQVYIFDEIDSGISGKTSAKIAEKIQKIARKKQVLLITHSPQIASISSDHFFIDKVEKNNKTITEIQKLDSHQRINKIAGLISKDNNLESINFAKKLLESN